MSAGQLPPPGTVLRKLDRNGAVRCEAVVGDGGQVIYRGVTYSSISAAAKVAAGDIGLAARSCDGFAFFGLKNRDVAPRSARPTSDLPLPLPVRWDDVPPAPPPPPRVPLSAEIVYETVFDHSGHGRADASGAPLDADCACRGSTREEACAAAGCGFCCAARIMATPSQRGLMLAPAVVALDLTPPSAPIDPVGHDVATLLGDAYREAASTASAAHIEPAAVIKPVDPAPATPVEPTTATDQRGTFDADRARMELLAEIDSLLQGTAHWQGGRLDTIKYLLARAETTDAMSESVYAFVRTVQVGSSLHTMHLAPRDRRDHDVGPWVWTCGCGVPAAPPFVGVEYANPEDGWRAVDEWEQADHGPTSEGPAETPATDESSSTDPHDTAT